MRPIGLRIVKSRRYDVECDSYIGQQSGASEMGTARRKSQLNTDGRPVGSTQRTADQHPLRCTEITHRTLVYLGFLQRPAHGTAVPQSRGWRTDSVGHGPSTELFG